MRAHRLFVSVAAIALVAGPGLAMAQNGPPSDTPPVDTPPVVETPPADTPPVDTPPVTAPEDEGDGEGEESDLEIQQDDEVATTDDDDATVEDEGHGEMISALAECLPSGAELHGTGLTKGSIISQAASTGEVELEIPEQGTVAFALPDDVETLCAAVTAWTETAETPETAKGRPDWAGPKDSDTDTDEGDGDGDTVAPQGDAADEGEVAPAERGGRPAHAGPPTHAGKGKAGR